MKKTLLLIAPLGLMLFACKKDRECSCKQVNTYTIAASGGSQAITTTSTSDYTIMMKDINLKNAYAGCTHTQEFETNSTSSSTIDINCELK